MSSQDRIAFSKKHESICQNEHIKVLRGVHVEQLDLQNKARLRYVLIWAHSNIVVTTQVGLSYSYYDETIAA